MGEEEEEEEEVHFVRSLTSLYLALTKGEAMRRKTERMRQSNTGFWEDAIID